MRDAGNLLTRAGLNIPSVDVDELTVHYRSPAELVKHLRCAVPAARQQMEKWGGYLQQILLHAQRVLAGSCETLCKPSRSVLSEAGGSISRRQRALSCSAATMHLTAGAAVAAKCSASMQIGSKHK